MAIDKAYLKTKMRINMGISIDIFPLDGVPKSKLMRKMLCAISRAESLLRREAFQHRQVGLVERCVCLIARGVFKLLGNARIYRWREHLFARYDVDKTGLCTTAPARWGYREDEMWPTDWFKEMVDAPFEYLTVKIPKLAEKILDHEFGDWHKFVKFAGDHGETYFDVVRPYKDVLAERFGYHADELQ